MCGWPRNLTDENYVCKSLVRNAHDIIIDPDKYEKIISERENLKEKFLIPISEREKLKEKFLIPRGKPLTFDDINKVVRDDEGTMYSNIFSAAYSGTVNDVKHFIDNGVDVNAKDKYGQTPLLLAAGNNPNVDVLKYLIEKTGMANIINGPTFLDMAALFINSEALNNEIEEAKIDANAIFNNGCALLCFLALTRKFHTPIF